MGGLFRQYVFRTKTTPITGDAGVQTYSEIKATLMDNFDGWLKTSLTPPWTDSLAISEMNSRIACSRQKGSVTYDQYKTECEAATNGATMHSPAKDWWFSNSDSLKA